MPGNLAGGSQLGDPHPTQRGAHHDTGTRGESPCLPRRGSQRGPHAGQAISLRCGGIKASIPPPYTHTPPAVSPFFIQPGSLARRFSAPACHLKTDLPPGPALR